MGRPTPNLELLANPATCRSCGAKFGSDKDLRNHREEHYIGDEDEISFINGIAKAVVVEQ